MFMNIKIIKKVFKPLAFEIKIMGFRILNAEGDFVGNLEEALGRHNPDIVTMHSDLNLVQYGFDDPDKLFFATVTGFINGGLSYRVLASVVSASDVLNRALVQGIEGYLNIPLIENTTERLADHNRFLLQEYKVLLLSGKRLRDLNQTKTG